MSKINFNGITIPTQNTPIPMRKIYVISNGTMVDQRNDKGDVVAKRQGNIAEVSGSEILGVNVSMDRTMWTVQTADKKVVEFPVNYKSEEEVLKYLVFTNGDTAKLVENHLNIKNLDTLQKRREELEKEIKRLSAGEKFIEQRMAANNITPGDTQNQ